MTVETGRGREHATHDAPWQVYEVGTWRSIGSAEDVSLGIRTGRLVGESIVVHPTLSGPRPLSQVPFFSTFLASAGPTASPVARAPAGPNSIRNQEALPRYTGEGALPDERLYSGQAGGGLIITSHRVVFERGSIGQWSRREIPIAQVSYVGVETESQPLAFAAAIVVWLFALFELASGRNGAIDTAITWGGAVMGLLFFLGYWPSRAQSIVIASSGGRISLKTSSLPRDTIVYLLGRLAAGIEDEKAASRQQIR